MFYVLITELQVVKLVFSTIVRIGSLGSHSLLFTLFKVPKVYLHIFIQNIESILLEKVIHIFSVVDVLLIKLVNFSRKLFIFYAISQLTPVHNDFICEQKRLFFPISQ